MIGYPFKGTPKGAKGIFHLNLVPNPKLDLSLLRAWNNACYFFPLSLVVV